MAEKTTITLLGTGSAIPTARRNHPAALIQFKNENILVDCGEGTQRQFRKARLNPCKVTRILITHWHGDHTLGLPGLLQTLTLNQYNRTLKIYGPKGTKRNIDNIMQNYMKFYLKIAEQEGIPFKMEVHEISSAKPIDEADFYIEASEMDHGIPSMAYTFTVKEKTRLDKDKLKKMKIPNSPLLSELAKGKTVTINGKKVEGKKLTYTEPEKRITFLGDTRTTSNAAKLAKDSNLLISEATYSSSEEEQASNHYHLTAKQAATIASKAKVKQLILTHLSQRYDTKPEQAKILKEAKEVFKNVQLAEDLMQFEV